ncbi:MAG: hypothetical protein EHM70_11455, partial [Chloroflexota bacterium]
MGSIHTFQSSMPERRSGFWKSLEVTMNKIIRFLLIGLVLAAAFAFPPAAQAHPLGNFTINQYAGLTIQRESVVVDYVVDMAEIPAFQEIASFDLNGDGVPEADEAEKYHPAKCAGLLSDLELRVGGTPADLSLVSSAVEFPPGVGGLLTLRLSCAYTAAVDRWEESASVSFTNNAYSTRLGWREIVVTGDNLWMSGDISGQSLSDRLISYPQDLLSSPLDQRQVEFQVSLQAPPGQASLPNQPGELDSAVADRNDAFTRLILVENINLATLLVALAISFVWGAMHALTPGHGKTIVGAYLVGSRATARHALFLGLTTTITHTAGVFALGLTTLFAARWIIPETLFPWLSFLSGLLVAGIGVNLFASRARAIGIKSWLDGIKRRLSRRVQMRASRTSAQGYILTGIHAHPPINRLQPFRIQGQHSGADHHHSTGDHPHDHDHSHAGHSHLPP